MVLQSIGEENLQQLLQDSRATSRAMLSRNSSRASSASSSRNMPPPDGTIHNGYHDNRTASQMSNSIDRHYERHSANHEDRTPFLPEIDPKGTLSTAIQGGVRLNNMDPGARRTPSAGERLSAVTVRNSFTPTNHSVVLQSYDSETDPTPRPPSTSKKPGSGGKHRTKSPHMN